MDGWMDLRMQKTTFPGKYFKSFLTLEYKVIISNNLIYNTRATGHFTGSQTSILHQGHELGRSLFLSDH